MTRKHLHIFTDEKAPKCLQSWPVVSVGVELLLIDMEDWSCANISTH